MPSVQESPVVAPRCVLDSCRWLVPSTCVVPDCHSAAATMGEAKEENTYQEELLDYEEEEEAAPDGVAAKGTGEPLKK